MSLLLTDRDLALLDVLVRALRVVTIDQAARTWFREGLDPCRSARRRLHALERGGLVGLIATTAHPELMLAEPVFRWRPGDEPPDLVAISARLQARWNRPPAPTTLVHATTAAGKLLGGAVAGRVPRRTEATHDIHVATVYLHYRATRPSLAKRWVSEQEQYHRGGGRHDRLPDAVIRGRRRPIDLIVEFGGSYSAAKLREMHAAFKSSPYEIW